MSQQINLLRRKASPSFTAASVLAPLALAAVVLGAIGWRTSSETAALRAQVQSLDAALANARASMQDVAQRAAGPDAQALATELGELRSRSQSLRRLLDAAGGDLVGSPAGYSAHFLALSSAAQEGVWVTDVNITSAGRQMAIGGRALRNDDVVGYVKRLNTAYRPLGVHFEQVEFQPDGAPAAGTANAGAPRALPTVNFKVS